MKLFGEDLRKKYLEPKYPDKFSQSIDQPAEQPRENGVVFEDYAYKLAADMQKVIYFHNDHQMRLCFPRWYCSRSYII